MKKSTLLLFSLFLILFQINAQVAIGSGNLQGENAPFEAYYGYSYAQTVYLASEINASGDITDIQWYYSGTSDLANSQDLIIYMAESTRTEFANTDDWEPLTSLTQVYAGGITVTPGVEGWVTLTLDTPFTYSGTDNLIIAVEENSAGYDSFGDDFYNSQVSTNRTISYFSDFTNPDPVAPPTASNIDDTIPNVIIGGITQACATPSDLAASGITSSEAQISWTENGAATLWNVEIVMSGDAPTGTPTATGVSNPYTAMGLSAVTTYDVYVQADCGTEQSAFAGPLTFETLCDVFVPDYLEDFTTIIPDCWDEADSGDPATGPSDLGAGSWTADEFLNIGTGDGAYKINLFTTGKSDWVISPQFDLTGGPFQVEFDFAITNWNSSTVAGTLGSDDVVQLLMTTDNGATWTTLLTYDSTSVVPIPGIHPVVDLTANSGQTVQFAIYATEGTTDDPQDVDVFVDNFQVRNIPSCPEPTDLAVSNPTPDGAEITWIEPGTSTVWNIEIVPAGDTPTGTPTATNVTNPYFATGLNAITAYDIYVQSDCGGDLSSWTGPATFTTLCDIFVPDYIENFTTIIPDCWDEASNGDAITGPTDLGAGSWVADEFLNIGTDDGAYKINLFAAGKSDWIISPQFDLTGGPFQVEFDFAITNWNSSTVAGTLGSDDTVQLLMTNDGGATWIELLLYDNSSVVPIPGIHPVVDLTAYSGQIVQFGILGSEGTVNDPEDIDVFVDNFQVRNIPTCPEPTDLTSTNLTLTSTEIAWTEAGTSTVWNIEYGPAGFAQGTGTIVNGVTNPFILTGLLSDTLYDWYVQAECDPSNLSSWSGPSQFFTGYCESVPTSNDGQGVTNVTIGIVDFPSLGDVTYENQTSPVVNVFQGVDTTVEITFATGFTYDTNIWIDFNDDLVFDASELVFQGESTNANPTILDASFVMPATAPLGQHRMRIGTADSGQATPNPCYNGSWGVTLDFTVNVIELTCTLPEASYTTVPDCDNDQFFIDVDVTSLGDATSLEISNNLDATTVQATAIGVYQAGPFPFGSTVKVFVMNEQDNNCIISSDNFTVLACPPDNDECDMATIAVVNDIDLCEQVTPGTILAATPSGLDSGTCTGDPNDDVWFEFTALDEVEFISLNNIQGGTTNLDHAVYEGTCGSLTELYCSDQTSSITPSLVVGNTYYIRVFSAGSVLETSTFDLCIREAPTNVICENAENFCSVGGALVGSNIVGLPDPTDVACLGSVPNPSWNIIQIGESGLIEIEIVQWQDNNNNGVQDGGEPGLDVDFAIWGPFNTLEEGCMDIELVDCPTCPFSNNPDTGFYPFGNIIDCSYSPAPIENLTIDNAVEGEIYVLLVTNFSNGAGVISIEQTNVGNTGDGTIDAEISAEITSNEVVFVDTDSDPSTPVEASVCGFDTVTIIADSPFADSYVWYKNGFVVPGETTDTLVVTESDLYQVQAFDEQCGADAFSPFVVINMYNDPGSLDPQVIEVCDGPESDGSESFDLDALTTSLGYGPDFTVTYYTNTADANQAMNAVSSPYDSSGETLVIRVEDTDAFNNGFLGCRQLSEVELVVLAIPVINQPADFVVCDDIDGTVDGITDFDLTSIDGEITTDTDVAITYHTSQADADTGAVAIASPYSSGDATVYVRAENTLTGCFVTTSFNLVVNVVPLGSIDTNLFYYDTDTNEFLLCPAAESGVVLTIIPQGFNTSDVTVQWVLDGNDISGANGISYEAFEGGDYSAIITFNATGCSNTISNITVTEIENCAIPQGISPGVSAGFNDTLDLRYFNVTKLEIFNRNGTLVYSKNNYSNEWAGQTDDGEELPVGTYFYTMVYEGGTKSKSGWIYINR
ncbi:T9SS type B sorting domain-containing protein [Winogradskyella vincentii]|uniref:Gliding motility-associated C-terminal domain-containing protein n=2 Tax=Pseudomonadati TaxID=3379134 RepID=A0ABS7XXW1_9FLAO|nr:gliding motility-associated C-terminal domain-containing protein [Winogradskyella vincentii]MCA0152494.1 gliding motility-associated C-terminal domain-containing protein [Winogradskyella vincentii]